MEIWPSKLPIIHYDRFSIQVQPPVERTEMDSGLVRQRRTDSVPTGVISGTIKLSRGQYSGFEAFWRHRLNYGADWFRLRTYTTGSGLELTPVRMVGGTFSVTFQDGFFDLQLTLECHELHQADNSTVDYYS